jgi:hypothetical protein
MEAEMSCQCRQVVVKVVKGVLYCTLCGLAIFAHGKLPHAPEGDSITQRQEVVKVYVTEIRSGQQSPAVMAWDDFMWPTSG